MATTTKKKAAPKAKPAVKKAAAAPKAIKQTVVAAAAPKSSSIHKTVVHAGEPEVVLFAAASILFGIYLVELGGDYYRLTTLIGLSGYILYLVGALALLMQIGNKRSVSQAAWILTIVATVLAALSW